MFGQVMYFNMAANLISDILGKGNHITSSKGSAIAYRDEAGKVSAFAVYKAIGDSKLETVYEGDSLSDATDKYIMTVGVLDAIGHGTMWFRNNR